MLAGKGPNSDLFPVSDGTTSCTQENVYQHIKFDGDREFELDVTVIDTKGFDDSNNGIDEDTVADFIASLKLRSAVVNAFGISIHDITLDGPIVKMMKLFACIFGRPQFFQHCILIFTKCSMNKDKMKLREKNRGQCDDVFAKTFVKKLCAQLDYQGDRHLTSLW